MTTTTTFVTGLMGAGKSRHLIESYRKTLKWKLCFAAHLTGRTGSDGLIESRNGQSVYAINLNKDEEEDVIKTLKFYILTQRLETIYIDEVQFFKASTLEKIMLLAKDLKVTVHFYGLLTTFTDELFEASEYLLKNIAQGDMIQLIQFCGNESCDNIAFYNARMINGKVSREGDTFLEEKSTYLPLCSDHYFL